MSLDMAATVRLRDVPGFFFDPEVWNDLVRLAGTKQNAIELLDAAHPEDSQDWWDCALPQMCEQERNTMFARGRALRSEFHRDLINGKYIAFGFFPKQSDRVSIPRDRLSELYPRFATERLVGRDLEYTGILVVEADEMDGPAAEFQQRLTDWMKARRADRMSSKKILEHAAKMHFGERLTQRAFDTAYKTVFNRRRGHPPKGF